MSDEKDAKHICKWKKLKAPHVRSTFGSWAVEKVDAAVARSTFRSQNVHNTPCTDHFWKLRCRKSARRSGAKHISKSKCWKHHMLGPLLKVPNVVSRCRRKGFCTFPKVSKTWGFCDISKNDGRRGTFEEDLQRCIFRGRRSTRDIFIGAVRRSGWWFPERGCILEHQILKFAQMILRDKRSTLYDLASLFRGRRSTLRRWTGKNHKMHWHEAVSSALNFPFWRKSHRIASFLMLPPSKIEEVPQNSFVFKLADRWIDRQTDR